jgi:hypothetical protein
LHGVVGDGGVKRTKEEKQTSQEGKGEKETILEPVMHFCRIEQ